MISLGVVSFLICKMGLRHHFPTTQVDRQQIRGSEWWPREEPVPVASGFRPRSPSSHLIMPAALRAPEGQRRGEGQPGLPGSLPRQLQKQAQEAEAPRAARRPQGGDLRQLERRAHAQRRPVAEPQQLRSHGAGGSGLGARRTRLQRGEQPLSTRPPSCRTLPPSRAADSRLGPA